MSGYIDEAMLQQIEQALQQSGLYVAPELSTAVTPGDVAAFTTARASAPTPVYAVVVDIDYNDPIYHGNEEALLATIRDDTGLDGLFLVVGPDGDGGSYQMTSAAYPDQPGDYLIGFVADHDHPRDVGAMLLDAVDMAKTGTASQRYDAQQAEERASSSATASSGPASTAPASTSSSGGAIGPAVTIGVLASLAVLVTVLLAGVRAARRQPVPGSATTAARPLTLPKAVLSTVRAAEDERHARQAEADVLALGEAIDGSSMSGRLSPAVARAWQAALDHYDVARRILDRDRTAADVIGALVLARRGRAALAAALRGKGWTPPRTCYFNPLHPAAAARVHWADASAAVDVPACPACARAVASGETPEDVLDFVDHGIPVHYFKLDLGVWSETGYGALEPDLLGRMFGSP